MCRFHHRLKTFARGWRFALDPDGTLHVTTPAGITRSLPPPGHLERTSTPPPDTDTRDACAGQGRSPDQPADDDPPPF
jgi:hypothetical protein